MRQVKKVEFRDSLTENERLLSNGFYVMCADMAKDGSARTAVIIAKVLARDFYFVYKVVNLFSIDSTDYLVIANRFKEEALKYNVRMLIYDANGIGAAMRDWLNKPTVNERGEMLGGLGIINPPASSEKDLIRYPKDKTICYEIKSGGEKGEQIHYFFFSRMSNGCITFPIKTAEALNLYEQNKGFVQASPSKQRQILAPYKNMDRMEEELKNLDIVNTSDKMSNKLKIVRRNSAIQKDFFSAAEYLVYAVNQYIELDYYKKKKTNGGDRLGAFIFE